MSASVPERPAPVLGISRIAAVKAVVDIVSRGSVFIVVSIVLRRTGADGLGAWSQLQVIVSLLSPLALLGLGQAMVPRLAPRRWTSATRDRVRDVVGIAALGSMGAGVAVAVAAAPLNAAILDWPDGTALFRWGGLLLVVAALETLVLQLLQARSRFVAFVSVQAAQSLTTTLAAVAVLTWRADLVLTVQVVSVARAALLVLCIAIALGGPMAAEEAESESLEPVPSMIRFGLGLAAAGLGAWTVLLADRLLLGRFASSQELGIYAAIYAAAALVSVLGAAFFLPAFPRLTRAWAVGGRQRMAAEVARLHRLLAVVIIPAAVFVVLVTRPVLDLVGHSAIDPPLLVVVCVVGAFGLNQWNGLCHFILVTTDGSRTVQRAWGAGAIVALGSGLVLISQLGITGAGLSTALAYLTVDTWLFVNANRRIGVASSYAWRISAVAVAGAALAAAAGAVILSVVPPTLPGLTAAGAVFWAIDLAVVGPVLLVEHRRGVRQLV